MRAPSSLHLITWQVHENIRANPVHKKKDRKKPAQKKNWKQVPLTYEERKANLKEKLATLMEDDE